VSWELFVFLFLATAALLSAISVITAKQIVHSVIGLVTCFIAIGCLFMMLNAEFVAIIQLLVYVGAVTIVILFGIMLTRREIMGGAGR
jgi:NADH-quinone oxidoreductase subunit J